MGANAKSHFVKKNKAENKPWFDMKCWEKDRVSIDVNENTVILKTKFITLMQENKYTYNKYSENEFMTQTNETCMIADQTRTLKAGITSI
jgi:hypothetical protein